MRLFPTLLVLLLAITPAFAQSNMGMTQYPAPKCAVPPVVDPALKPPAPDQTSRTTAETDAFLYNSKVRAYNTAMRAHNEGVKTYAGCVQGYIAAGKADVQHIQFAIDTIVASVNGAPAPAQPGPASTGTFAQYPAPKCAAPPAIDPAMKPATPTLEAPEAEVRLYNAKMVAYNDAVRAHNDGAQTYAECVQGYIAAGKADIQRIQAAIDAAVDIANGR